MPSPICVKCAVQMTCKQNDFIVRDRTVGPFPSTYWRGDLWECPVCHQQFVDGFGQNIDYDQAVKQQISDKGFLFQ